MAVASVKSKVISGLKWNTISVAATRSTDFVVQIILARLLIPDAFGVVGMAMVIIGFLQVVSDMGLFNALVQKKEDEFTNTRYSSAFWFLLLLASAFILCFFLFVSPLGASFYKEPRLLPILNALSFYLFLNILTIIPRVILTKHLDFKSLVQTTILGTAIGSSTAIIMAFLGFGVWSLVVKYIVTASVLFCSYWLRVGWRPTFVFDKTLLTSLAGYSIYTQVNSILYFFRSHVDYLVIGKLVSAHALGVYTLAFTLSEVLRAQLYSILNKVFFPVYSKLQDDLEKIKEYYLKIMRFTAIITFPISILFIGLAEEIMLVVFGEKWLEAAPPLRILSVASMIFAISGTPAEVLKGIGKPNVSFTLNLCNTFLVALPLIYFGLKYFGLVGVGYAVCIHYTTSRLFFHYYMKKYIHITDQDVYRALRKPVFAALVMLSIIYALTLLPIPVLAKLIVAGATGSLAYGLFFIADLKQALAFIKNKKKKTS
ncbi:lipopolysaccharide biosynthesis protein [Pontibacter qinzhouensis]|uniref:Lipopolysaccharide biosynthesis protein n=1 Tax=Pontibacter qinzhouensis TaxID=2603253 RepID=A0A5C8K9J9_9BACT|nr:lipopolysaccharide biosynthesis protein [Pontibacter qinzhouensis]TXK46767.1 lipopolysaccharide biosynthesis protein [Pontibacter qinzhouensis]